MKLEWKKMTVLNWDNLLIKLESVGEGEECYECAGLGLLIVHSAFCHISIAMSQYSNALLDVQCTVKSHGV